MATPDWQWVRQRLPGDVKFDEQTVMEAVQAALTDNLGDKYSALADLWERIDAEQLYLRSRLDGAFATQGPLALQKSQYWRGLSASGTGPGEFQAIPVRILPPVVGLRNEFADFPFVNPADHSRWWVEGYLDSGYGI